MKTPIFCYPFMVTPLMPRRYASMKNGAGLLAAAFFALSGLAATAQANPNAGIEEKVRAAFPNAPEMLAVAKCESGFRQFGPDGSVLRGGKGGGYVGVFQIGESLHARAALALGHDIMTVDGNIAYAQHLYDASGSNPWKECVPRASASISVPAAFTADLRLGSRHAEVTKLQRALNAGGFSVAAAGPGSPGNETDYFGALTREAVRRFQCAQGIVCEGAEASTGYGRVGPRTRAALNRLAP